MRHRLGLLSASLAFAPLVFSACGPQASTGGDANVPTTTGTAASASPIAEPTQSATGAATLPIGHCGLPAPKKSTDSCTKDDDCGPSDPCHAHACVAKAKSNPPGKDTVCTQILDCESLDINPCVCFEGVCALVPPKH
ncbi:MAG: hypothetical protein IPK82_04410 [Polyangiaceae bacterium]|nr:hypothetical protein [Polyangiaceae bacterium]